MCGIVGMVGVRDAAAVTGRALYDLEHRGQNSTGMVWRTEEGGLEWFGDLGQASSVLRRIDLACIDTTATIGHTRYPTTGSAWESANIGPQIVQTRWGKVAVSHNGNLVNTEELRTRQRELGIEHRSTTDTEVIVQQIALAQTNSLEEAIVQALQEARGSYSVCFLTPDKLIAGRDPHGIRPLVFGRLGDGFVVASETCVFDALGAKFIREIEPGELMVFNQDGYVSGRPFPSVDPHPCVFEEIYFLRPDSMLHGESMLTLRERLGRMLATDAPPPHGDCIIVPVPRSGLPAAHGYARALGLTVVEALVRRPGTSRTFIAPGQEERMQLAWDKYSVIGDQVSGQNVVLVDDSLVRGTTAHRLVQKLRAVGAKSVHIRAASPRIEWPCLYGIDMPTREELIAASLTNQGIADAVGADSVAFLALDSLKRATHSQGRCMACFTGRYPISVGNNLKQELITVDVS